MNDLLTAFEIIGAKIITRYSPPTQWDKHPKGTVITVPIMDEEEQIYVQRSADESDPDWEKL